MTRRLTRWLSIWLLVLAVGLAIWQGRGYGAMNWGLLKLAQVTDARGWEVTITDSQGLAQAQRLLEQALSAIPTARSARRNLGMAFSLAGQQAEAQAEWQATPGLASEFAQYGEKARRAGNMASAYVWFGRAWELAPTNGQYAVWQARAAEQRQDWPKASAIYRAALAQEGLNSVGPGELLYRLGLIYQLHLAPPDMDQARAAYSQALATGGFASAAEEADAWYHLGEIQQSAREFSAAVESFEQTLTLNPGHYWAQLRLAQTAYDQDGNAAQAVTRIQAALQAWPEEPSRRWPYQLLGSIYQRAGQITAAIDAYEAALRYDPTNQDVAAILRALRQRAPSAP